MLCDQQMPCENCGYPIVVYSQAVYTTIVCPSCGHVHYMGVWVEASV